MNQINSKIIEAIIQKSRVTCPDSLALIGVYGSFLTGDTHPKSDLDLMILINDERGRVLSDSFVLDDVKIGYDIYCTTWEMLENDSECCHAYLSKLLDSSLVYVNDRAAVDRLEELRSCTRSLLSSNQRKIKAKMILERAKIAYSDCLLIESLSDVYVLAGEVIYQLMNCLMIYHGRYFKMGIKRTFEELESLVLSYDIKVLINNVIAAESIEHIRQSVTVLMKTVIAGLSFDAEKEEPSKINLSGTYEEMYSNWRGKMYDAAERGDLYSSYVNMVSLQLMIDDIAQAVSIKKIDVFGGFSRKCLESNAILYDNCLDQYLIEYKKAQISPRIYNDVDDFISAYLSDSKQ